MDLALETEESNVGIRMSILERQFSVKMDSFDFFDPNLPKNRFRFSNSEK